MPVLIRSIAIISLVLIVLGCSSEQKRYKVSGTVQYKGQPLPYGSILFIPEDQSLGSMGGSAITNGTYEIPQATGLLPGKYKVSISFPDKKGLEPKEGEAPGESREAKELLPAKYNSLTELRAEVKPGGDNTFSFDLN